MIASSFGSWVCVQLNCRADELASIRLEEAFAVLVCRVEDAARRHVEDPLAVVRNSTAGGNSRAATRRMLGHLGYTDAQLRIVHRLLGGSPAGWPGLLALYVVQRDLAPSDRAYARRQLRSVLDGSARHDRRGAIAS